MEFNASRTSVGKGPCSYAAMLASELFEAGSAKQGNIGIGIERDITQGQRGQRYARCGGDLANLCHRVAEIRDDSRVGWSRGRTGPLEGKPI